MEIGTLHKNYTFKVQITFDRHNARQKLNYCFLPDPPHFLLLSTYKVRALSGAPGASSVPAVACVHVVVGVPSVAGTRTAAGFPAIAGVFAVINVAGILAVTGIPIGTGVPYVAGIPALGRVLLLIAIDPLSCPCSWLCCPPHGFCFFGNFFAVAVPLIGCWYPYCCRILAFGVCLLELAVLFLVAFLHP